MDVEILSEFLLLLGKHHLTEQYICNVVRMNNSITAVDVWKDNPNMWVTEAFAWKNSPEGAQVWSDLYNEWNELLKQLIKQQP